MSMIGSSGGVSGATNPVAFSGTIVPTAISGSYRLGLLLVTIAMILVPLLYLLLIAAVAWFFVWHVTTNTAILTDGSAGSGGAIQWRVLGYFTPALVSGTLLFFMVKPMLARRPDRGHLVQVSEAEQPALHALIREICRQVRAPLPSRVQVDCQVNASASLRGGVLGIFRRDIDLTIGLPLVTGLSVRELSGVLAHEFGHFAQGGGMRMTAVIRGINGWLFRVVHERDNWDSKLEEWSKDGDWRVTAPMALARLSVWTSRKALGAVTMVGHGVSCYMMRQMEFDADSYEVKIAGTDAFRRTFVRLRELSAGSQLAYRQLPQLIENRAVPADLPQMFVECSRRLPDEIREQVQKVSDERTGTFDTHPSDADRMAAAHALASDGALVGGDEPATVLFRNLDQLSVAVTRHHYERDLGISLYKMRLVANDEALRGAEDQQRTDAAVREVIGDRASVTRPLRFENVAGDDTADLETALEQARAAVKASSVSPEAYRAFEHYHARRDLAFCAEQLFLAGLQRIHEEDFSLASPTLEEAQSTQRWALEEQGKLREELDPFEALLVRRLSLGVAMLERQQCGSDARVLMQAVTRLGEAIPFAVDARRYVMARAWLERATPVLGTSPHLRERMSGLEASLDDCRMRAFDIFSETPAPGGEVSDAWRRLQSEAAVLSPADVLQRILELYWACLSRLARLAADAEASAAVRM
jgi:Zn-dependent protease with chaperone function